MLRERSLQRESHRCAALLPPEMLPPTFAIEVAVAPGSLAEGQQFSLALYAVDWDGRGRRGTVALLDGASLDPISPIQQLSSFGEGVWLKYNYSSSLRIRVSQSRGDNCVVSALVFGA